MCRNSVWIALCALPAFAQLQSRPAVLQLSLKQAVEIALAPEGSTRVKLAEEALKQAQSRSAESRAALLPDFEAYVTGQNETVNLRAFGLQFPSTPILGFTIPTVAGPFTVWDARATLNQTVFDFSSLRRYRASKIAIEAAKAETEGTRDQVTDQVAKVYLSGLRAQAALDAARANVELSEALLKLAQSQKNAGTGTGIEITRADVQRANDRQRLLVADNELERAHLELLRTIGIKLDNSVELTDQLKYIPADNIELRQALDGARKNRPELRAQQRREETARLNYSATKFERLPSVAAFANYGSIGAGISEGVPTRTYGASLRIPLFDGGRRDARRAESASTYRQERVRTADVGDQVELEVRLALNALRSAEAQVKAAEEGLSLAENELAQAQRRYKAGVANGIEVTDAQTRVARARDNRIQALYNHNLARIDLGTATGSIQSVIQ